jgi:hypothetical protein
MSIEIKKNFNSVEVENSPNSFYYKAVLLLFNNEAAKATSNDHLFRIITNDLQPSLKECYRNLLIKYAVNKNIQTFNMKLENWFQFSRDRSQTSFVKEIAITYQYELECFHLNSLIDKNIDIKIEKVRIL